MASECECGGHTSCTSILQGSTSLNVDQIKAHSHQIPLMNSVALHYLKDGHLVRFRGMIQDMHNPEFYFETYEIRNKNTNESRLCSGKYRDTVDVGEFEAIEYNSPQLKGAERHTATIISLPGLNEWAKKIEREENVISHLVNPPSTSKTPNTDSVGKTKRTLDTTDCQESNEMEVDNNLEHNKDRQKNINKDIQFVNVSRDHILNFPLPDEQGKVCFVKVYEDFESLKLNDMVEVIGFLSVDPALSNHWNGNAENDDVDVDVETLTHNPPPSLVPRIHAIHVEKLEHCNPLIKSKISKEKVMENAKEAREHLHKVLTQILLGDSLAADYLICHLISHVYIRRDVLSLGKFTLNLWKIPSQRFPQFTNKLYNLIEKIVTKSHYLALTTENLNDLTFIPKKDYDCNRLTSGILQLSKNTHLLLDETKMQPGQLNSAGVVNITSLGEVIQNQKLKYDFKFYSMEYDCDIPMLILSEGKSLLPNEVSLPIVVDESSLDIIDETFEAAEHYLSTEILNNIRIFLTSLQLVDYYITEEPKYVQEDFISMRNDNTKGRETDAEDLHRLLVLTRLIGLSKGYDSINQTCWNIAKNMEEQRHARLQTTR